MYEEAMQMAEVLGAHPRRSRSRASSPVAKSDDLGRTASASSTGACPHESLQAKVTACEATPPSVIAVCDGTPDASQSNVSVDSMKTARSLATLLTDSHDGLGLEGDDSHCQADMPPSASTTPCEHTRWRLLSGSPMALGSFDVSESFDTSRSLNFELSPIRRFGDTPGRVVGAVAIRPTCDLSGLSDCTEQSEASMDSSFSSAHNDLSLAETEVAELSAQDGTEDKSDKLPMAYFHRVFRLQETVAEVDGDTGSTLARTLSSTDLRCDYEAQHDRALSGMIADISEQLDSIQELAKEVNSLSQHHDLCEDPSQGKAVAGIPDAEMERLSEHRERESASGSTPSSPASDRKALKKEYCPLAESIPTECTMLHHLRNQDCCLRMMLVIVPQGLREDRLFRVNNDRKTFEFIVPDGVIPGDQLTVQIPRIPPLDAEFKREIFNQLAHPLKWRESRDPDGKPVFLCDETRKEMRMQHYQSMKGSNMDPTVATIDETKELEDDPEQLQPLNLSHLYTEGV